MAHDEAGDPTLFPSLVSIPDDGDAPDAAAWTVGLEALLDRTAYLLTGDTSFSGDKSFGAGSVLVSNDWRFNTAPRFSHGGPYSSSGIVDIGGSTAPRLAVARTLSGSIILDLGDTPAPATTREVTFYRTARLAALPSAHTVMFRRETSGVVLCTMDASAAAWVTFAWITYDGVTGWWPITWGGGLTIGV